MFVKSAESTPSNVDIVLRDTNNVQRKGYWVFWLFSFLIDSNIGIVVWDVKSYRFIWIGNAEI